MLAHRVINVSQISFVLVLDKHFAAKKLVPLFTKCSTCSPTRYIRSSKTRLLSTASYRKRTLNVNGLVGCPWQVWQVLDISFRSSNISLLTQLGYDWCISGNKFDADGCIKCSWMRVSSFHVKSDSNNCGQRRNKCPCNRCRGVNRLSVTLCRQFWTDGTFEPCCSRVSRPRMKGIERATTWVLMSLRPEAVGRNSFYGTNAIWGLIAKHKHEIWWGKFERNVCKITIGLCLLHSKNSFLNCCITSSTKRRCLIVLAKWVL